MSEQAKDYIYDVAQHWRNESLINGRSLFWHEPLWKPAILAQFQEKILADVKQAPAAQIDKMLQDKLGSCNEELAALACELYYIYALFSEDVNRQSKEAQLLQIAQWGNVTLPDDDDMKELSRAFDSGCGYTGPHYHIQRIDEIQCLVQICETLIAMDHDKRQEVFLNPALLEKITSHYHKQGLMIPSILNHLFFPDHFEPIVVPKHKERIALAFRPILPKADNQDYHSIIPTIRQRLKSIFENEKINFYNSPLQEFWLQDAEYPFDFSICEKLDQSRQIILFGPTGMEKKRLAREISEIMIRRELLRKFNAEWYFARLNEIDKIINDRIIHVPLHKNYGYDTFVRDPNDTSSQGDGTLLKVANFLQEKNPENVRKIPYVVILDDFDRVNPEELFGETFPLLLDRRGQISLRGKDRKMFSLPDNLFFLATMNPAKIDRDYFDSFLDGCFLWFLCAFNSQNLMKNLQQLWEDDIKSRRGNLPPWETYAQEFATFAHNAQKLNDFIAEKQELGVNYQIGYRFFENIFPFAKELLENRRELPSLLYTPQGEALSPIKALWHYVLEPFITYYESRLSADDAVSFTQQCERLFFTGRIARVAGDAKSLEHKKDDTPDDAKKDESSQAQKEQEDSAPEWQEDETTETEAGEEFPEFDDMGNYI